ncbi:c-type cytochrome biogenesis protein CcsB [Nocardia zapadnayensis]|uniref:c-type cytochrome biogenesis protein CcsB n=1 Tax=unclassified Brevibacterium TaxID=2614124 RepID=UPI001FFBE333|nr:MULTISPECIES: c-type cytochrome biogenesis protein CcsB [Actinomycetes]MCK1804198.1 c-type cytochrome biogenesis protein CcsB [Brevibacterium sp. R8603A2]MCX0277034.1 c-type cytochrome biogenesis protein CcsB [Nocardia zapadnayensis]
MDVNIELATWSNLLIYSAMAVYAIAFITYAFDLFGGRTLKSAVRQRQSAQAVAAGSRVRRTARRTGSVAVLEDDDAGSGSPADRHGDGAGNADPTTGRSRRLARVGTSLTALALVLHAAAVATRALSVMRGPWGNMMEYALTTSALAVILYLAALKYRDLRYLGTFVSGAVLVTLGLCITVFYTPAAQLVPALQSYWIYIHVPIAILSTALLSISAALAVFQIIKAATEQRTTPRWLRFMDRLPSSENIEQVSYRIAAVGFITWTFTLIAGAVWAELAWGRYWGWDTKEIWTFVVWVVYAAYLHARATRGWGPTRVAVLNLTGFASVVFNFAVVNIYFSGLHSYSGV